MLDSDGWLEDSEMQSPRRGNAFCFLLVMLGAYGIAFAQDPICSSFDSMGDLTEGAGVEAWVGGGAIGEIYLDGDCSQDVTVPAGRKFAYLVWKMSYWTGPDTSWCDSPPSGFTCDMSFSITVAGGTSTYESGTYLINPYNAQTHFGAPIFQDESWYDYGTQTFGIPIPVSSSGTTLTVTFEITSGYTPSILGLDVSAALLGDFGLRLTAIPETFRPRSDVDATSVSGCVSSAALHCKPVSKAFFFHNGPSGTYYFQDGVTKIKFLLANVSNLTGSSTNQGTSTDPDYVLSAQTGFDAPTGGGSAIQTTDDVVEAQVEVLSRDYGGTARLTAQAVFPGPVSFDLDAVVEDIQTPLDVVVVPGCISSPPNQFAQLPRDEDCNGIADSWEQPHLATLGLGSFSGTEDVDDPPGTTKIGDGFTVLEEYRGFHYLDRATALVKWTTLNPAQDLDLFLWDKDGLFHGNLDFFRNQLTYINLRELDNSTARVDTSSPPNALPLNLNTASQTPVYPLLLVDETLGSGCNAELGHAPDLPAANGPDGRPIRLDHSNINSCTPSGFQQSDWRKIIVAHEIGHNLGRRHPSELRAFSAVSYSGNFALLANLPLNKYTYDPSPATEVYTWLRIYTYNGSPKRAEDISDVGVMAGRPITSYTITQFVDPNDAENHVLKGAFTNSLSAQNVMSVQLSLKNGSDTNVMNWSPRYDYTSLTSWSFSSDDKENMCVKPCP